MYFIYGYCKGYLKDVVDWKETPPVTIVTVKVVIQPEDVSEVHGDVGSAGCI